jgi:hypothetical protein
MNEEAVADWGLSRQKQTKILVTKSSMTQPVNDALHFCVLAPKSFWQVITF